ncbi:MAG: hypothetical protein HF314_13135 [Ignavibacteria bacterium]|jgi:hypothetical protein|nr:hypothetical protein [Ignavibacteria bacterium]MCU7504020.1 hypothetical protein [Ignavibacteria bacterium]MCU7515392.1 hypothetical protein [Ignavibacteria bacterium]
MNLKNFYGKSFRDKGKDLNYEDVISQASRLEYICDTTENEICLEVGVKTKYIPKDDFVKEVCEEMNIGKPLSSAIHYAVFSLMKKKSLVEN